MSRCTLGLVLLSIALTACDSLAEPATGVVVVVDSDLGDELSSIDVTIYDRSEQDSGGMHRFVLGRELSLPFSFGVAPRADFGYIFTAVAAARDEDGIVIAQAKARATFVKGQTLGPLSLFLDSSCRQVVPCEPGEACHPSKASGEALCGEIPSPQLGPYKAGTTLIGAAMSGSDAPVADDGAVQVGPTPADAGSLHLGGHAGSGPAQGQAGDQPGDDQPDAGATGVDASVNQEPDSTQFAIATQGSSCDLPGDKACDSHDGRQKLTCFGGEWSPNGSCDGETRCQTRIASADLGTCQPIAEGCRGKQPDAATCDGDGRARCGVDLLDYVADPCPPNEVCRQSAGVISCGCGDGFIDCDGDDGNGCEPATDSDHDGTADCFDACPDDGDKLEPGACGCGSPDTDRDADGVADCNDECPDDENKQTPGECGCDTADTDRDHDGTPDCHDSCPDDEMRTGPCFMPSNVDTSGIDWSAQPTANIDCSAITTIDTTDPDGAAPLVATFTNWCGAPVAPLVQSQVGGPNVVVLTLRSFTVAAGSTLRVIGNRPLIIAVDGPIQVDGTIDASASGATPGAGGNVSCNSGTGRDGGTNIDGAGGGGGGGFGASGAAGGDGGTDAITGGGGGQGGAIEGVLSLSPLRGGCRGGSSRRSSGSGSVGGGGGGAIELTSSGTLSLGSSATISAGGGGGLGGTGSGDGGGGGGSGGAVLLEAQVVSFSAGDWLTANGGAGAGGFYASAVPPGADGLKRSSARAAGSIGPGADALGGGDGGAAAGNATAGDSFSLGIAKLGANGGGGGGGGVGRIRIHALQTCSLAGASYSPSATTSCP